MNSIAYCSGQLDSLYQESRVCVGLYDSLRTVGPTYGLESLSRRLHGTTFISTEGLLDKVKGIFGKIKSWLGRSYEKTLVKLNELIGKFKGLREDQIKEIEDIKAGRKKLTNSTSLPISPKAVNTVLGIIAGIMAAIGIGMVSKKYFQKTKNSSDGNAVAQQKKTDEEELDHRAEQATKVLQQSGPVEDDGAKRKRLQGELDKAEEEHHKAIQERTKVDRNTYFRKKTQLKAIEQTEGLLQKTRDQVAKAKNEILSLDSQVASVAKSSEQGKSSGDEEKKKSWFGKLTSVFSAAGSLVTKGWSKVVSLFSWLASKLGAKSKSKE